MAGFIPSARFEFVNSQESKTHPGYVMVAGMVAFVCRAEEVPTFKGLETVGVLVIDSDPDPADGAPHS